MLDLCPGKTLERKVVILNLEVVGDKIKSARKMKGITQQELAARIHRTESSVRKYEKGLIQIPNDVLEQIAAVLNTSPLELLCGASFWDEVHSSESLSVESKIVDGVAECFGEDASALLQDFVSLNATGQKKALDYISDLSDLPQYKK